MSVADSANRARHDLGKYVCFQVRWLPEDADDDALRGALKDDLLRTRRGPAGEESAAQVWAGFRAELLGVAGFSEIDGVVDELARRALTLDQQSRAELDTTAALARRLAELLRDLARSLSG